MSRTKTRLLWLMSFLYCAAGFNHVLNPDFYLAIIPPGLPSPDWLNLLSGLAEIVLGVYVLEPRVRVLAAWGIIALLVAVFPANVYVALENVERVQADAAGRAQHGDAQRRALSHRSSPRRSRPTRNTGPAAVTLSTRSSRPP